ncbi:hypothetical protein DFH06DRAFT_509589 [Mycena polygramma]|nr:hypothetical protein DFH06DRAFT_509589 [Mycena polygramma]
MMSLAILSIVRLLQVAWYPSTGSFGATMLQYYQESLLCQILGVWNRLWIAEIVWRLRVWTWRKIPPLLGLLRYVFRRTMIRGLSHRQKGKSAVSSPPRRRVRRGTESHDF